MTSGLTWGCQLALRRLLERRYNPFLARRARLLAARGLIEPSPERAGWRLTKLGREVAREVRR